MLNARSRKCLNTVRPFPGLSAVRGVDEALRSESTRAGNYRKNVVIARRVTARPACPNEVELRNVRAIAITALTEAARHGRYRAFFRGFRVRAWRKVISGPDALIEVGYLVTLGGEVAEEGAWTIQDGIRVLDRSSELASPRGRSGLDGTIAR